MTLGLRDSVLAHQSMHWHSCCDFQSLFVVTVVFRASHSAAAVENGSVSVIFAIVEQLWSKPSSIYQAVTLLFKQKASFYLFSFVLVNISRLLASSVPHLAYVSQREHRAFTIMLFLGSRGSCYSASLSLSYLLLSIFSCVFIMCLHVPWCTCGGQRTVCSNWFFPFTTWGPIKIRSFRLTGKHLYQLSLVYLLTLLYPGSLIILCRNNREMYKYIL